MLGRNFSHFSDDLRESHRQVSLTFKPALWHLNVSSRRCGTWFYSRRSTLIATLTYTQWRRMGDRGNDIGDTWSALREPSRGFPRSRISRISPCEWTTRSRSERAAARAANAPAMQFTRYFIVALPALIPTYLFLHACACMRILRVYCDENILSISLVLKWKKIVVFLSRVGWQWRDCRYFFHTFEWIEIVSIVKTI